MPSLTAVLNVPVLVVLGGIVTLAVTPGVDVAEFVIVIPLPPDSHVVLYVIGPCPPCVVTVMLSDNTPELFLLTAIEVGVRSAVKGASDRSSIC